MTAPAQPLLIRQSSLNLHELCGEAYRRSLDGGGRGPSGTAAIRGSAFHKAAEVNHRQKIRSDQDLPKQDLIEIAHESFGAIRRRDGFYLTPEEMSVGVKPSLERARRDARDATAVYSEKVAHRIRPAWVEEQIEAEIPGAGIRLRGRIDTFTRDKRVKDFKSTMRAKRQEDADSSLQFSVYGLLDRD